MGGFFVFFRMGKEVKVTSAGKRHAPDKLCACFPLEVLECLLRLFAPAHC